MSLDKEILRALDFVQYDDSTFIIPDYSGDSRFCWVNRQGKLHRKTGTIPTTNEDALNNACPALAQAWRSLLITILAMECWRQLLNWVKFSKSII